MGLRVHIDDDDEAGANDERYHASPIGFREFYEAEFGPQVRRAGLVLASTVLAADVVQDAFVAVWQRWPEIDEPGQYLSRCVMNGCRSVARHNEIGERALRRLRPLADHAQPSDNLWDALGALGFEQRAPIVLRYYGRLDNHEFAAALVDAANSVGVHCAVRNLGKLRPLAVSQPPAERSRDRSGQASLSRRSASR